MMRFLKLFGLFGMLLALPAFLWAADGEPLAPIEDASASNLDRWVQVSTPTNENLNGIDMVSATDGWAVGDNGIMLRWDGSSWSEYPRVTSAFLYDVEMYSADLGYAVGFDGVILKWNGSEWSQEPWQTGSTLWSISIVSPNDVWVVGNSGVNLHWNGSSWNYRSTLSNHQLFSIDMVSSDEGWIGGYNNDTNLGVIFRWDGNTWQEESIPNTGRRLDLKATSADFAMTVGEGSLYWLGDQWLNFWELPDPLPNNTINSCDFTWRTGLDLVAPTDGWIVGGWFDCARIYHIGDDYQWTIYESPVQEWIEDVSMVSSWNVWAAGHEGTILQYRNTPQIDVRQAGEITISGDLEEGGTVYLDIPVKNYGSEPTPALHPYTEGYTAKGDLWRADGADPTARVIQPGETVIFRVQHPLWYEHAGRWKTYGVYLWNDEFNDYLSPLPRNGHSQALSFFTGNAVTLHIEITQAIQDEINSVTLIENKRTTARVYAICKTNCPSVGFIEAKLHAYDSNGDALQKSPLESINKSILVFDSKTLAEERGGIARSLNFDLPPEWLKGTVKFEVTYENLRVHTERSFQSGKPFTLAWTFVPYLPPDKTIPQIATREAVLSGNSIFKVLPLAEEDYDYVYQHGFTEVMEQQFFCAPIRCPAKTKYIKALNRFWDSITRENQWKNGSPPDRLFGWIPGEAVKDPLLGSSFSGLADATWASGKGRVAVGADYGYTAKRILHEVGHLWNSNGLVHTPNLSNHQDGNCASSPWGATSSYPNATGLIDNFGFDVIKQTIKSPDQDYDFMSYCVPPWVSKHNYEILDDGHMSLTSITFARTDEPSRQIMVSGIVYSPTLEIELDPFYVITSTVGADASYGTDYCIEILNSESTILDYRCFDLSFSNIETGGFYEEDVFSMVVPYPLDSAHVRVVHQATNTLASEAISPNPPEVTITSPNGGESFLADDVIPIEWSANDADGDNLHFMISYSIDSGDSWVPVGIDITELTYDLPLSELPGAESIMLRVKASDGLNTSVDVTDSVFTVETKAPYVAIVTPNDNSQILVNSFYLQGFAYDLEDGNLPEEQMVWSSDISGVLGNGKTVLVSDLPIGTHLITLTAVDSDGNEVTEEVTIQIGSQIFLPTIIH